MIKQEFRSLFEKALAAAIKLAKIRVPSSRLADFVKIDLHAPNAPHELINLDQALDAIYIGEDQFYKIIDVAVWRNRSPNNLIGFVRVSGHLPCPLSQTWDPDGLGPFKPMIIRNVPNPRYAASGA